MFYKTVAKQDSAIVTINIDTKTTVKTPADILEIIENLAKIYNLDEVTILDLGTLKSYVLFKDNHKQFEEKLHLYDKSGEYKSAINLTFELEHQLETNQL